MWQNFFIETVSSKNASIPTAYFESGDILILFAENESTNKKIKGISKMIFPIRCISCNNVIAGKWKAYLDKVKEYRSETKTTEMEYLTVSTVKTAEGKALDDLNINKVCCRRHFLAHVDLM